MAFDHELKLRRAFKHFRDLNHEIAGWLGEDHCSVRQEYDPDGTTLVVYATAEQPPNDEWGVLIGDCFHNLRSGLDALAHALASAHTVPLTDEIAYTSEFPIFGDEDRAGNSGVGCGAFHKTHIKGHRAGQPMPYSGLHKIRGWCPDAQTVVERLQPYHGPDFREHPLWLMHDLDRVSKHRLLHTTIAASTGWV